MGYLAASASPVIRISLPTVNVKDFGARGNGVADDNQAFRDALDYLGSRGGGKLIVPSGTYMVDEVVVRYDNITIEGSGWATVLKLKPDTKKQTPSASNNWHGKGNVVNLFRCKNATLKDLKIDGNRDTQINTGASHDAWWNGIRMYAVNNVVVDNVWSCSNGYHGIIMVPEYTDNDNDLSTITTWCEGIVVRNSRFTQNGYRPFHGHGGLRHCKFISCHCEDNGLGFKLSNGTDPEPAWDGIFFFDRIYDLLIEDCTVIAPKAVGAVNIGGTHGREDSDKAQESRRIKVRNCTLIGDKRSGVSGIVLSGADLHDSEIVDNTITGFFRGIDTTTNRVVGSNIVIDRNQIVDCMERGIHFQNKVSYAKITRNTVKDCRFHAVDLQVNYSQVYDNTLIDNGSLSTSDYDGIVLRNGSLRNHVRSNEIVNTGANLQRYGILENTSADDYNVIEDNRIYGMSGWTNVNRKGPNSTSRRNTGQESSGIAVIASGQTTVSVPHDLRLTPNRFLVTAKGDVGAVWVSAASATTITISCQTAPASDVEVTWGAYIH